MSAILSQPQCVNTETGLSEVQGGCFTNVSQALQDILSKFVYCRNHTSYENFKLKFCMCAQSMALDTHTKFQLHIPPYMWFLTLHIFARLFSRARKTLVKQPPGPWRSNELLPYGPLRTLEIGELVIYFYGGALQNLLGALENTHGEDLRPPTKYLYRKPSWNGPPGTVFFFQIFVNTLLLNYLLRTLK